MHFSKVDFKFKYIMHFYLHFCMRNKNIFSYYLHRKKACRSTFYCYVVGLQVQETDQNTTYPSRPLQSSPVQA